MNDNDAKSIDAREARPATSGAAGVGALDAATPDLAAYDELAAAHERADQPEATFKALDAALARSPGHILFTILVHHPSLKQSERFYSNMPEAYPVGGRKPVTDSPWMKQVVFGGQPWICHNRDDVREAFYDYELIGSLGCEGMLNMPVRWRGQTLGTLNLSHKAGHYNEGQYAHVRRLGHLALPALLGISRH